MTTRRVQKALEKYIKIRGPKLFINNIYFYEDWESDLIEVDSSDYMKEYEVKVSRSDFRADFEKKLKHYQLTNGLYGPNQFYYVCPKGMLTADEIPDYAGLLTVNDKNWVQVIKPAPLLHKNKIEPDLWEKLAKSIFIKNC